MMYGSAAEALIAMGLSLSIIVMAAGILYLAAVLIGWALRKRK